MTPPLIGLTSYGRDAEEKFYLRAQYVDAVRRAGGLAVLVPPGDPRVLELLERLDGLILAGGGDIDPALYGGREHETIYMVDAERDRSEMTMARAAADRGLPTLGICRGCQVLNVALGGTLFEHLPEVVGDAVPHRTPEREPTRHDVTLKADSRVARVMKTTALTPASWHHQAVNRPAPGVEVVAHAPDGTIEALELPQHPWLIAVQWHPELRAAEDPAEQRLFDELVKAAAARRPGAGR